MMQNHYLALINQQILLAAADALRTQDAHLINQLGLGSIDELTANQLRQVSVDRLACLSNFRGTLLDVRLNVTILKTLSDQIKNGTRGFVVNPGDGLNQVNFENGTIAFCYMHELQVEQSEQ